VSKLNFGETVIRLRNAAAIVYDRGKMGGKAPATIAEEIAPLANQLEKLTQEAIESDFEGVILAIKRFEAEAQSHARMAQYLTQKSADIQEHAERLKARVIEDMKLKDCKERAAGDFLAVICEETFQGETKEVLLTR